MERPLQNRGTFILPTYQHAYDEDLMMSKNNTFIMKKEFTAIGAWKMNEK